VDFLRFSISFHVLYVNVEGGEGDTYHTSHGILIEGVISNT
jgi:hypothetical protein